MWVIYWRTKLHVNFQTHALIPISISVHGRHFVVLAVIAELLLSPLMRSTVITTSVCVCVSVCLSVCLRGYIRNHTRDLCQICEHVAYGRGSILPRQGDEIPRGRGSFGAFLPR